MVSQCAISWPALGGKTKVGPRLEVEILVWGRGWVVGGGGEGGNGTRGFVGRGGVGGLDGGGIGL